MARTTRPGRVSTDRRSGALEKEEHAIVASFPSGRAFVIFTACALIARGASADSAIGADTVQGNLLNSMRGDPTLERDRRGISLLIPGPSRTPSGFLYESPFETRSFIPLAGDWRYRLSTELGAIGVHYKEKAARFRDYGDFRGGALVNYFNFGLEQSGTRRYFDVTAGAVGREDQYYRATFGRYGDFRTSLYFSQVPKAFTDQAHTVFQGAGSGNLTLRAGLLPGNNSPAQIAAALQSATPFDLGFSRKKTGLEIDATPGTQWRLYARYTKERKNGVRPFGGAFSYPGVPAVETIEPIDYKTHDVLAGVQWAGDALQANLGYAGSFFRNAVDTLTWENPLTVDPATVAVLQRGRMDLYPDNGFHNLNLDLGAALPLRGQLSGGFSFSRMTQDDNLIAPTVNSGTLGGAPNVNLADWNTTGALSKKSAGARIDTRLLHLSGSLSPLPDLSLQARLRRYEEDNKTRYTAFNPLTGQFGYLGLDGGLNNIVPGFLRVQIHSIPFEYRKNDYSVEGEYRLLRRTNFTLGYEQEEIKNQHREYGRTGDGRFRVGLSIRDIPWATVRLSYGHAKRSGDNYNFNPNRLFYSGTALVNAPATLAELRKYDLADRRQQIVNGQVNLIVAQDMDLALSGRYVDNDYGAAYGRLGDRIRALNLAWNWQPDPKTSAYAHYGYERMRNRLALISDDPAGFVTGDPDAGGAVYPLSNRWEEASRDDAHVLGMGFRLNFAPATLESGYVYLRSHYRTRYSFASSGAIVGGPAAAGTAGNGMPDLIFRQHTLETSLKLSLSKDTALRLYHRYERARFEDWHHDVLPLVFANGIGVFLGAGPQNHAVHVFGLFFQYTPGTQGKSQ